MTRHPTDRARKPAEARLARYLEIERRERVHGRHRAVDALHRRAPQEALSLRAQAPRIETPRIETAPA